MNSEARVVAVDEVIPHPNADRLDMVRVGGWWCASQKGVAVGDKKIFLPPDTLVPLGWAVRWGIDSYTQTQPGNMERVRATRLRGQASFGALIPCPEEHNVGDNIDEAYGLRKYEPPHKELGKDCVREIPDFPRYTKIGHLAENPYLFKDGERVQVREKIHGTNCRVGMVNGKFVAGSHNTQRLVADGALYALPLQHPGAKKLLVDLSCDGTINVVLYAEIFGQGIQDMRYGQEFPAWRAFDIWMDGGFLTVEAKTDLFELYGIPNAPVLYDGPYRQEDIIPLIDGPTTICPPELIKEPFKGREGIMITAYGPLRKIARAVSVDYHTRENRDQTEEH